MANNFFFVSATVVILPLIPAFILFKFLPSKADGNGPQSGLSWKFKGAFAGYIFVLLALMSFVHTIPSNEDDIWTVRGTIVAPEIENVEDLRISVVPDQSQRKAPNLDFTMRVVVLRDGRGNPDFPHFVIEHPLYRPQTIRLDQGQSDCNLARNNAELNITGDCLKLTKRGEKPNTFESQLVPIPEH